MAVTMGMRLALLLGTLVVAALSACAGARSESPPPPPRGSRAEHPSAPSAAPRSEPPPDVSPFGPVRPIADPAELERLAYLKSFCEVGVQGATDDLGQRFGCTCCPPFVDCPPRKDGSVVENPDHVYGIEGVAHGHFTRKDAEQELVTVHGCGESMNGGSVAVLDVNGGKRVAVASEDFMIVPARCAPYRVAHGHDLAVCEAVSTNQSHHRVRIVVGDFAKPPERRWQEVVQFHDSSIAACFGEAGVAFVRETLVRRGFVDTNRDGRPELELELDTLRARSTQPFIDRCVAWLEAEPAPSSTPAPWDLLGQPRRDRLTFLHDGSTFVASPDTKRVLSKRPADAP